MTLPVAILAGGLATRLGSVTAKLPKALIEVAGKPFVVHQLEVLRAYGVERVVMCVAHLDHQIQAVLGDGAAYGLEIAYSHDGDALLGTGGALRRALPLLGDAFLTLYGDSYLACDYEGIAGEFLASGKQALMTVYKNDGQYDASNVEYRDGQLHRYDKTDKTGAMTHIDWGLGAFQAAAFSGYMSKDSLAERLDLATVYQDLLARGQVLGYEVTERFYEIGSFAGLEETRALLASKDKP